MANATDLLKLFQEGRITQDQLATGMMNLQERSGRENLRKSTSEVTQRLMGSYGPDNPEFTPAGPGGDIGGAITSKLPTGPQIAGSLGGGAAAVATGGTALPLLPALMGMAGGAMSKTPGDAAKATLLGGLGNLLPTQGASRAVQALKGALAGGSASVAGDEAKSLVDNGNLSLGAIDPVGLVAGAGLGAVAGGAGARPAGALSPKEEQIAALYDQHADYRKFGKEVAKMENNGKFLKNDATDIQKSAQEAAAKAREVTKALRDRARETHDMRQAQYLSDIHAASTAKNSTQEALDQAMQELTSHQADMTAAENAHIQAAKKLAAENLKAGRNPDGTTISKNNPTSQDIKAKEKLLESIASEIKKDPNTPVLQSYYERTAKELEGMRARAPKPFEYPEFEHPPEVLKTEENLMNQVQKLQDELDTHKDAYEQATAGRLAHKANVPRRASTLSVPQSQFDEVEKALEEADKIREAARLARQKVLTHEAHLKAAKNRHIDREPEQDLPNSNPLGKLAAVLSLNPYQTGGAFTKPVGRAMKIASILAPGIQGKAPEATAPGMLKQFLVDKLGANVAKSLPDIPLESEYIRNKLGIPLQDSSQE